MAKHEPSIGLTDEWFTPPEIFAGLRRGGLGIFDLDPAHPGRDNPFCVVPAKQIYTKADDGLRRPWRDGCVFVNPPFGGRYGHVPWLAKFFDHGDGIAICRAYTSSNWWHALVVPRAETVCFPCGKTRFVRPDGSIGTAPGHGIALLGMGAACNDALRRCGLGWFVDVKAHTTCARERDLLALLDGDAA